MTISWQAFWYRFSTSIISLSENSVIMTCCGSDRPGGVIERDVAAVGDDTVDELDLSRLERQRAIALIERLDARRSGSLAIILSKMLSSWMAMVPSRQPVQPKYFEYE